MLKVTTKIVMNELIRRGLQVEVITEAPHALLRYFHDGAWHLLHSTLPPVSSATGKVICDQKYVATTLAKRYAIPVPATEAFTTLEVAQEFLKKYGQIVVKPADAAHGNGITVGVGSDQALKTALTFAREASLGGGIILQQMVGGSDLRMLVIDGKFVAAARRIPAAVIGDGRQTIRELIAQENATNPERGENDEKRLAKINLAASERFLGAQLDTMIPKKGEEVTVVGTANIGAGGRAVDYTDAVSAELIADAEKFAQLVQIFACGVDFIWNETAGQYYFIEGNSCPGFNLHIEPSEGISRPVDKYFVDALLGEPEWARDTDKRGA
jgi:cyanophycin synthetase